MNIRLQQIVPVPFRDKAMIQHSDIWNKDVIFKEREYIKVKAPSGTGKTTLVHIIYKMRYDYDGTVWYDNTSILNMDAEKISTYRQTNISIVFQDLRLFPHLTARENIELKRTMHQNIYEKNIINEMAERLGVQHVLDQPAAKCSYGEQQRIAIIRSLMQPFKWLIMDEPFSHLDVANAQKAATLIVEECKKRNAGIILTDLEDDTHFNYTRKLVM